MPPNGRRQRADNRAGGRSAKDCELILRALDLLDRHAQDELANKQDAELIDIRCRLLFVRAKLRGVDRVEQLKSALRLAVAALEGQPCRRQALDDARAVLIGGAS